MTQPFDAYGQTYAEVVQRSIAFSGLKHDLFLRAKVALLADLFREHFGPIRPSLLDVGCGIGALHEHLAPIVGSLAGSDPSSTCLDGARLRHPEVDYREQGETALPWPDRAVDVSLAVCAFHHVPRPARAALTAEMRRVSRPGGLVVIVEHNPSNPLTRLAVARCPFDHDAELLGAGESRSLLRDAGLSHVRSRHFLVVPGAGRFATAVERPLRAVPLGAQYAAFGTA